MEPMSGADGVNLKPPEPRPDVDFVYGGNVGDAIQKTAAEVNASLIIMGAQGKGMLEGMLSGSVSTEVLRQCETNLLIIRHRILENGGEADLRSSAPIYSPGFWLQLTSPGSRGCYKSGKRAERNK